MSSEDAASSSGVLSRSSVYTTLRSLDRPSETDAAAPANKKLLQFYSKLSTTHHRQAVGLDCKNTAGRPLSATDVASRLELRGLTLTGGGYNTAISSKRAATTEHNKKRTPSRKQQKYRKRALLQRIAAARTSNNNSATPSCANNNDENSVEFLQQLNAHWNQYITKLLPSPVTDTAAVTRKLQSLLNEIEWIGARVQVDDNNHRHHGILVSQTARTWRIAPLKFQQQQQRQRLGKTITIPKQQFSLKVLIPIESCTNDDEEEKVPASNKQYLHVVLQPC